MQEERGGEKSRMYSGQAVNPEGINHTVPSLVQEIVVGRNFRSEIEFEKINDNTTGMLKVLDLVSIFFLPFYNSQIIPFSPFTCGSEMLLSSADER